MRNAHLKTVRQLWKECVLDMHEKCLWLNIRESSSARIFFGRSAVMAKALGTTPEGEHRSGLHILAKAGSASCFEFKVTNVFLQQIKGQVGLLFTDTEPQEVIEWFADFKQPEFARAGNLATHTVILPAGPVMQHHSDPPEPLPHNEEPQLRKLGLTTTMNRGVPTLQNPHQLCEKGKPLTAEQAQLLKLTGVRMALFRVRLMARWSAADGQVVQIDSEKLPSEENLTGEDSSRDVEDEDMVE